MFSLRKKYLSHLELDGLVTAMHDFIKVCEWVEMLDPLQGVNVFPRVSYGCQFSTILLESLQAVDDLSKLEAQSKFLNKKVNVGKTPPFVSTYLERAPGRVQDAILIKFVNSILAGIPMHNPISSASSATDATKNTRARQAHDSGEFYSGSDYKNDWKMAYRTAIRETRTTGNTVFNNMLRLRHNCFTPSIPSADHTEEMEVSIYFLAFLILKLSP